MMKHILTVFAVFASVAAAHAETWPEGATFDLNRATTIEYGAGDTWTTKKVGPGSVPCTNATFGDPLPGAVKSCRTKPRFSCLPAPLGSGTRALFRSGTKGDFVAWYCPGLEMPDMVVCLKASCGLVGMKRALAAFASNPSLDGLNAAMEPFQRNAYTDPELISVWQPFAEEIRGLIR